MLPGSVFTVIINKSEPQNIIKEPVELLEL